MADLHSLFNRIFNTTAEAMNVVVKSGAGGVSQADNSAFTNDADSATPVAGQYAPGTTLTSGAIGVLAATIRRALRVAVEPAEADAKYASIDCAAAGDNEIVAAVVGKKVRVVAYTAVCANTVSAQWKSGAATAKSGAMPFAANGGASPPWNPYGHFETAAGEALNLNLSGAVQVSGHLTYLEVS